MSLAPEGNKEIRLDSMPLTDLTNQKKRVEGDYQTFQNSFNGFKYLGQKFEDAKCLIKNIKSQAKDGEELLVPMTNSLFLPGTIDTTDCYLVEIGAGYYAERNAAQIDEYCTRKAVLLKKNCDQLTTEIESKRTLLDHINVQVQKKTEAQQIAARQQAELANK